MYSNYNFKMLVNGSIIFCCNNDWLFFPCLFSGKIMLGYIGAFLLGICALPQAIMSVVNGNSYGLSSLFLWCWYIGEILMLYFVVKSQGPKGPLFLNYAFNTVLLTVIVYYKYFPRRGFNG